MAHGTCCSMLWISPFQLSKNNVGISSYIVLVGIVYTCGLHTKCYESDNAIDRPQTLWLPELWMLCTGAFLQLVCFTGGTLPEWLVA